MSNTTNTTSTQDNQTNTQRREWDPNKTYTLQPTDTFTFTGPEFNFMYQCLLTYGQGNVTDMKAIRAIQDCFTVMHGKFVELVENGTIRERTEENRDGGDIFPNTEACLDKSSGCNSEVCLDVVCEEPSRH